ncbi:YciI family protein [Actinophytocola sp.]|uniref:YciI family protein n=1 Tax=Actinophytocola sp. TaxID=1872138 RepID=UPI002D37C729|nr:YciI family protein [Actinophytocola sp.]HYQ64195.1 YciI family protein [Actinophytocola sp.]
MRFLMFVTVDPDLDPVDPDPMAWADETTANGQRLEGQRLRPVSDATTLWPKDGGGTFVSDGPFAETKEQIAGYDLMEFASVEEAVEVAAKHPVARFGAIELRPVWE